VLPLSQDQQQKPQTQETVSAAIQAKLNQAIASYQQGKLAEAERIYREILRQQPNHSGVLHELGVIALRTQRTEQGIDLIARAIALDPKAAVAHCNLAAGLVDLKRHEEALAYCDQAIALRPDFPGAHYNRGNALIGLGRFEQAVASYDRAIALKPGIVEAHNNRGQALMSLKQPEQALASYDKAIALAPDYAAANWNQSLCLLQMGSFALGWQLYEWRKRLSAPLGKRSFAKPEWLGKEAIADKTLFVHCEQGFGDTIHFFRYGELLNARGAKVIMSVQEPLYRLLKQTSTTIEIINQDEVPRNFDYHCPLLSLPLIFGTTLATIRANIPYVKANAEKTIFWRQKLGEKSKTRIGLVWTAGIKPPGLPEIWSANKLRNIPLAKLAALKHPDIDFYSLQKGQPAEQDLAELLRNDWDGPQIFDYTNLINDFSDTAALIENLDLVISVDTATAHLAGAMGKPVWILHPFDTCWRWLLDRTDSPWYPTAKLYRQNKADDWDEVVQRVKSDLARLT
jgi:tetratricopeptide (TPR) repeat protein